MKNTVILLFAVFCASLLAGATAQEPDDPAAHALYDKMVAAMREAKTLSYKSHYRWEGSGRELGNCTYHLRMKKPNYFHMDTVRSDGSKGGVLIGDGDTMWIHWPNGRPISYFSGGGSTDDPASSKELRKTQYMKKPTPVGVHSIAHQTVRLGAGMGMTVIDPSTFHGYTDSLQPYVDGVRSEGTARIGGERCDVILVSIMKGQRTWKLWLSQRDHLPRKLRQVVHARGDIITDEVWTDVKVNARIPSHLFAWTPPKGWTQRRMPRPADRLLKVGAMAPDFALTLLDGSKVKLSDFRGKVVWLNIWRVG